MMNDPRGRNSVLTHDTMTRRHLMALKDDDYKTERPRTSQRAKLLCLRVSVIRAEFREKLDHFCGY